MIHRRRVLSIFPLLLLALAACSEQPPTPSETPTRQATSTSTPPRPFPSPSPSASPTLTPTTTATYIPSATPSHTLTPSVTPTETPTVPVATVAVAHAFCRYGPGTAYLYSHGLYMGDTALVDGRNASGTWLWLKPFNLERHCWAAASVLEVSGDQSVPVVTSRLPFTDDYGPPQGVQADRDGDEVTVTWQPVPMTQDDDRGYLQEVFVCQNGQLLFFAVQTYDNHYVFTDEEGCTQASNGLLYTVSKHGYSTPVEIPWP